MAKRREKPIDVIAYLSTDGNMYSAPGKERKQLRYIKEYANAHNSHIVKTMNRDIAGNRDVLLSSVLMKEDWHLKGRRRLWQRVTTYSSVAI